MKDSLRKIQPFGYFMTLFQFLFLSRHWKEDQIRMRKTLDSILSTSPSKMAILIYPEGTNISEKTVQRSHSYADKVQRPKLKNVLLPHTTGLYFCVKALQSKLSNAYIMVSGLLMKRTSPLPTKASKMVHMPPIISRSVRYDYSPAS